MLWYLPDRHPIFWHDFRRRTFGRRGRWLAGCGVVLAFIPVAVVLVVVTSASLFTARLPGFIPWHELLWNGVVGLQGFLALAMAPGLTASVIAGERARQTLDLLLLAPISSRALVMEKFLSAFLLLAIIPFAFLPITTLFVIVGWASSASFAMIYAQLIVQMACFLAIGLFVSCGMASTMGATAVAYIAVIGYNIAMSIAFGIIFLLLRISSTSFVAANTLSHALQYIALLINCLVTALCLWLSIHVLARLRGLAPRGQRVTAKG